MGERRCGGGCSAITHTAPSGATVGIEIPPRVRRAIGLGDAPCWVIVCEHNVDAWPNGGLSPIPGRPGQFSLGFVPPSLFADIKATVHHADHQHDPD